MPEFSVFWLVVGLLIGAFVGIFAAGLCRAAKQEDKEGV